MLDLRAHRRLNRRIGWTRLILLLEHVWPLLWPPVGALGFLLVAGLFNLPARLPAWVHPATLGAVVLVACHAIWRIGRTVRFPTAEAAKRRLEKRADLRHRPLDALEDFPISSLSGSMMLWQEHVDRARQTIGRVKLAPPKLSWLRADPWAIRSLLILLFFIGVMVAGPDAERRLRGALTLGLHGVPERVTLDVWVTPPDYTGRAPQVLQTANEGLIRRLDGRETIEIPIGSTVTARVGGGERAPELVLGDRNIAFDTIAGQSHEASETINDATLTNLRITQGGATRADWPVAIIPDRAPAIGPAEPPGQTQRFALDLRYFLDDDYGVTEARLIIQPQNPEAAAPLPEESLTVELSGARTPDDEPVVLSKFADLTPHPWAGEPVTAVLIATDDLGQEGRSDPVLFNLPERPFDHPVAQEIIAARKQLLKRPSQRRQVAVKLDQIARVPGRYDEDLTVFAALRTSFWRLNDDPSQAARESVADILWWAALRLEDGQLSVAERNMRDAFDQFEQALSNENTDFSELTRQLEQMMQQFLSEQFSQQQNQQGEQQQQPQQQQGQPQGTTQVVTPEMLQAMINEMRARAEAGDMEGARQMLEQLRRMMENMTGPQGTMTAEQYRRAQAANRAAEQLNELNRAQEDLLNSTGRQMDANEQRSGAGQQPYGFGGQAGRQQTLQQLLEAIGQDMRGNGLSPPDSLERAGEAMGQAQQQLRNDQPGQAMQQQAEAVEALREAIGQLQEQVEQARQQARQSTGTDPLGRSSGGLSRQDLELPEPSDIEAVQEILRRLRERISDPSISESEREYLRRLLRRF